MSIIHRHLLITFLRNFAHTMASALVLFTFVDLMDHTDNFMDNNASLLMIGRFYLYKMGWIVDIAQPVSLLMATLFTIGTMARYLELTALFASGWSLLRISSPLIAVAFLMMIFSLAWREYVLPVSNAGAHRVWEVEIHKQPDRINPTERVTLTDDLGRMYYARKFDPNSGLLTDLKIVTSENASVVDRIDAARAEWDGNAWTLFEGSRRTFVQGQEVITYFDRLKARDLTVDPKSFFKDRVRPEDMNFRQLKNHIRLLQLSGGDPTRSLVDFQFKMAFPFVNIIVVMLGIILASAPRKTTIASGFGLTLLISFGYFIFMEVGRSLGHNGTLHPILAAWSGNLLYTMIFLAMFFHARR
ncbi:MAG: LptF/LptG family permease [Gemmatimonadales bacterium]|nr:LptF/LptG family permease [Gemmatimonadales bacterium]